MSKKFTGIHFPIPIDIIRDGGFGVNVFFVISGLLITKLLLDEENLNGKISLRQFYLRRTFRIFPAYYFLLFVYLLLQLLGILYFTASSWLSSIFYTKYLWGGDWETGHFWSLSVEEHFYLFWPLAFKMLKKWRNKLAVIVIFFVMICRLNAYFKFIPITFLIQQESLFMRADALMIGCLTAINYSRIVSWIDRVRNFKYLSLIIFLSIAIVSSDLITRINIENNLHLGFILIPLGVGTSSGIITNILIAVLIVVSIELSKTPWFSFLNSSVMNFLGKLSYSLYLWQQVFFSDKIGFYNKLPLNLLLIFVSALISYYLIEQPFLRIKDRISLTGKVNYLMR